MKKIISTIIMILMGICVYAQRDVVMSDLVIKINKGKTYVWTPKEVGKISSVESGDGNIVAINNKNSYSITIAGNNVGTTIVTASDGEKTVSVKVIVTENITLWKGPYVYNPPQTNYKYTVSESDGDKYSYAGIGDLRVSLNHNDGSYEASFGKRGFWGGIEYLPEINQDYEESEPLDPADAVDRFEEDIVSNYKRNGYSSERIIELLRDMYMGNEIICDVECWVFYVKGDWGFTGKYWIDPSNGCCLKSLGLSSGRGYGKQSVLTTYDIHYQVWTDDVMPVPFSQWKPAISE